LAKTDQIGLPLRLKDQASFENFLAGDNQQIVALLQDPDVEPDLRVIYLHGAKGAGKSHLLQAFCKARSRAPQAPAYVSLGLEGVAPQMIADLNGSQMVCLDDIDSVSGNPSWEEGILALYERLIPSRGSLIVASRYPPSQAGFGLADLATRLASGGTWRVQPLNEAQLPEAMQLRARLRGLELSDAVVAYLLRRVRRDPATLFALLDQIDDEAFSHQRRLTVPFVRELAGRLLPS
jgi:DnaA family protein